MLFINKPPKLEAVEDLCVALQHAIELEHATIPAYLTALFSIRPGQNSEIALILRRIATEEMLHMALVCNVLNAIGGEPRINTPGFVPTYPGALPMGIGNAPNSSHPFVVPLKKLSLELVREVFIVIEEPSRPLEFGPSTSVVPGESPEDQTIDAFYTAIIDTMAALGPAIFTGSPERQVTGWFSTGELIAVTDLATARRALTTIKAQGEGSATSPLGAEQQPAHYYQFESVSRGRALVADALAPLGYSYSGAPIPFDPLGVYPMIDNPSDMPGVELLADEFDAAYSALLNALHRAFNGSPARVAEVVGLMYAVKVAGKTLVATPIAGTTSNAGPRFRFVRQPFTVTARSQG